MNPESRKTVVITGSSGRIGSVLTPALQKSFHVISVDRVGAEHTVDIAEPEALYEALKDRGPIACIIHLAASSSLQASWEDAVRNNILATHNVYETARRLNISRVLFASSCEVTRGYEKRRFFSKHITTLKPLSEDMPTATCSPYGMSKVTGEYIAQHYADTHGISSVCLRIGVLSADNRPYNSMRSHQLWLSHRDAIHAFECALAASVSFGVYNVISCNDRRFIDLTRAREELGYHPQDNAFNTSL